MQKAYDSVDREILFRILRRRSKNSNESSLISLIEQLHRDSVIEVGSSSLNAEMGLPQGSILSPVLFNIYLEEALNSSEKLKQVSKRGDLLAFADDTLVMTSDKGELEIIVNEIFSLSENYNLRLNKKKSEILTLEKAEEIGGIRCT